MHFETYIADAGDNCDSCGSQLNDGELFIQDDSIALRWRFCSFACAIAGVSEKSPKTRFIAAVLNR